MLWDKDVGYGERFVSENGGARERGGGGRDLGVLERESERGFRMGKWGRERDRSEGNFGSDWCGGKLAARKHEIYYSFHLSSFTL